MIAPTVEDLTADPHPWLARLREDGPIAWVDSIGGWMVVGHALATEVMRDAERFTVDDPRFTTSRVVGPSMLSTDGADHARHRQPFVSPFSPRASRAYFADFIERESMRLVLGFARNGSAELRTELAAPLATACMQMALGLERIPVSELLAWYGDIVAAVAEITAGAALPDSGRSAYASLSQAVLDATRSGHGFLREVALGAGALTTDEMLSNTAVLLFGGIETTEGMIANLLLHVLSDPALLATIRSDRALLEPAIEESLRMEPAAAVVDRYATEDVSIGGVQVRRGDLVVVSLAGANRDPQVFPDPDVFDPYRDNLRRQLAFAQGPHVCIGLHVARLQARCAGSAVLSLSGIEFDAAGSSTPIGLVFRKPPAVRAIWPLWSMQGLQ